MNTVAASTAIPRALRVVLLILLAASMIGAPALSAEELGWQLSAETLVPVKEWIREKTDVKNDAGKRTKSASFSKLGKKISDDEFIVSIHINTAREADQLTERFALTVAREPGKSWDVTNEEVVDSYIGMHRETDRTCHTFDGFEYDRFGLELSAGRGTMCRYMMNDDTVTFALRGEPMQYEYAPPEYAGVIATAYDYVAVHKKLNESDLERQFKFDAEGVYFFCATDSCDQLIEETFTGLDLASDQPVPDWLQDFVDRRDKERAENPFAHFRAKALAGHEAYSVLVARDNSPLDYGGGIGTVALPGSGVSLDYNNWGGWEVQFSVWPKRLDVRDQIVGALYGYYSEETTKNSDPYDLERRDDFVSRWYEVYSLDGEIELGLEDPEMLHGDVEFGINLKHDVQELPFFIASFDPGSLLGDNKAAPLFINSIRLDGEELTWVKTGRSSGLVILPEKMPAGTKIDLSMDFSTRAIIKYTPSFSYVNRFGWMPFVSFGDFIDEFDLTIRSDAKYKVLGIGHRVSETVDGDVATTVWKADSPVVFPSITFGRYKSAKPKFDAKKLDGTVIPVEVHVDNASFASFDISPKSLRPLAEQAANSINLYAQISGIDYPYGSLNIVNDPLGFLYGQAPSSLIYLGQGVFRGEGALAPFFSDATGIAKFLKSVTAHEVGHQWWGSRVSNSNNRNYWFVETLAEYFSAIYLEAVYGQKAYDEQVDEWRRNILNAEMAGSVQNASSLFSGDYQSAVYNKGPYAFHMLRELFRGEGPPGPDGADKHFFDGLKRFSQELAEKREIVTLDIQNAAESAFGGVDENGNEYKVDLDWFFDQWIRGAGVPQYQMTYDSRRAEDGGWIIDGTIRQRIVIGSSRNNAALEGRHYRGVVDISVIAKGQEYTKRIIVDAAETPFQLKVPARPQEVALNKNGAMLSHDVLVNKDW